jgi:hypothetical protein
MAMTLLEHLDPKRSPKRILALDGGGIRGVLTLEYLESIETMLRERFKAGADFRLCDYFDLIGGTSTGSIIAAGLACGMSVAELKTLYTKLGTSIFKGDLFRQGVFRAKYESGPVRGALETALGAQTSLGGSQLRTGLMVMTKRLDSGSPWPMHNNPQGRYFNPTGGTAIPNKDFLLPAVVRASTAAPHYFDPEIIEVARDGNRTVAGAFVDGGVSPFNDPSLQLLMLATLEGYRFCWATGAEALLLISVGTGTHREELQADKVKNMPPIEQAARALGSLMNDCAATNQQLMQWLTRCLTPWSINREVGNMIGDSAKGPNLATYVRYNAILSKDWLHDTLKIDMTEDVVNVVRQMDNAQGMQDLQRIGQAAAAIQIGPAHFPTSFDPH